MQHLRICLITTSKAERNFSYNKLGIRVSSRVAKQRKSKDLRKLENITKISRLVGVRAQYPITLQK